MLCLSASSCIGSLVHGPSPARWPRGPSPASHRMIPVASIPISEHRCSHGRREGGRIVEQTLARSALSFSP